jgi:hypothetical protein
VTTEAAPLHDELREGRRDSSEPRLSRLTTEKQPLAIGHNLNPSPKLPHHQKAAIGNPSRVCACAGPFAPGR